MPVATLLERLLLRQPATKACAGRSRVQHWLSMVSLLWLAELGTTHGTISTSQSAVGASLQLGQRTLC